MKILKKILAYLLLVAALAALYFVNNKGNYPHVSPARFYWICYQAAFIIVSCFASIIYLIVYLISDQAYYGKNSKRTGLQENQGNS